VHLEVSRSAERPATHGAHERLIVAVQTLVTHQISVRGKPAATDGACELAFRVMNVHVTLQVRGCRQLLPTHAAVQLSIVLVNTAMLLQVALVSKRFATLRTHVRLLLCVRHL